MSEFDEAFSNGEQPEAEQQGSTAEPENESTQEPETNEKPDDQQAEEQQQAKQDDEDQKDPNWQYKAYKDELRKRQDLERQLQQFQGQMQRFMAMQQQGQQPPQQPQDFYSDPEGFISSQTQTIQNQVKEQLFNQSEEMMRLQFPDYDEKREQFLNLVQQDPSLRDKALNHSAPAAFIYKTVKEHEQRQKIAEIGDIDSWKEQERKRMKEEILAELNGQAKQRSQELLNNPSLADARGQKGDQPLSEGDVFDKTFS